MNSIVRFTLAFLLVSAVGASAHAQAPEVLLISIESVNGDDNLASDATFSLRTAISETAEYELNLVEVTAVQVTLVYGCEALDRMCLNLLAGERAYGVEYIVFGTLRRNGEGANMRMVLELSLFSAEAERITHRLTVELSVLQIMTPEERGRLAREWFSLLRETPVAEEVEPEESTPPPRPGNPHEPFELAGWSLIGVAGASFVGALVSGGLMLGIMGDAEYQAYRSTWDATRVTNVCDAAAGDMSDAGRHALGVCNEASLHEILVPLFWTVAGLAGAAGIVLAWHPWTGAGSAERPVARLTPSVSPTLAGLNFSLSY